MTHSFLQPHEGRLKCVLCGGTLVATSDKAVKQHLKSITHKRAVLSSGGSNGEVVSKGSQRPAEQDDEGEDAIEARELAFELGLPTPDPDFSSYIRHRQHFRALLGVDAPGCLLPPPVFRNPRKECPALDRPFLTPQAGAIPVVPECLDDALHAYFTARKDAHPRVDVEELGREVVSWTEARRVLQAADADGRRFWCTFHIADMAHPTWYPKACKGASGVGEGPGSAPTQDQIIVGRGRTGIGIHADSYGPDRELCSCLLTIMRGRKHVVSAPACPRLPPPVPACPRLCAHLGPPLVPFATLLSITLLSRRCATPAVYR